jgi:hypothetical protein
MNHAHYSSKLKKLIHEGLERALDLHDLRLQVEARSVEGKSVTLAVTIKDREGDTIIDIGEFVLAEGHKLTLIEIDQAFKIYLNCGSA